MTLTYNEDELARLYNLYLEEASADQNPTMLAGWRENRMTAINIDLEFQEKCEEHGVGFNTMKALALKLRTAERTRFSSL